MLEEAKKKFNIVIPVFNEQEILQANINILQTFCQKELSSYDWQITIADNGSSDETPIIGKKLATNTNIKYLYSSEPGRGQALRSAFLNSTADYCAYMDIDLATDLTALPLLIKKLDKENFDLVIGSRFHQQSKIQRSILREIISRSYIFFAKLIVGTKASDLQCGFKGFNQKVIQEFVAKTKDDKWFFDSELIFLVERAKLKICEIPVNWVETRNIGRKSKVKLIKSIWEFINNLIKFKIYG